MRRLRGECTNVRFVVHMMLSSGHAKIMFFYLKLLATGTTTCVKLSKTIVTVQPKNKTIKQNRTMKRNGSMIASGFSPTEAIQTYMEPIRVRKKRLPNKSLSVHAAVWSVYGVFCGD